MNPNLRRSLGVVAAVVGGVGAWSISERVFGVAFLIGPGMPMSALVIATGSFVAGTLGWAAAALLARLVSRPRTTWVLTGLTIYALSIIPVSATLESDMIDKIAILAVHAVVGGVLMWAIIPTLPGTRHETSVRQTAVTRRAEWWWETATLLLAANSVLFGVLGMRAGQVPYALLAGFGPAVLLTLGVLVRSRARGTATVLAAIGSLGAAGTFWAVYPVLLGSVVVFGGLLSGKLGLKTPKPA